MLGFSPCLTFRCESDVTVKAISPLEGHYPSLVRISPNYLIINQPSLAAVPLDMALSSGAGRQCLIRSTGEPLPSLVQPIKKDSALITCRAAAGLSLRDHAPAAGLLLRGTKLKAKQSRCQVAQRRWLPVGVVAEYGDGEAFASNGSAGASTGVAVADRPAVRGPGADVAAPSEAAEAAKAAAAAARAAGVTKPMDFRHLVQDTKKIVLMRHGLSSWNAEGRVQGSSDLSVLSEDGKAQVVRCREALSRVPFDQCFASPITRAKTSAELIWDGREGPLTFLDQLREAHLLVLEGMYNTDAKKQYPELFQTWREDPASFNMNGVYPVVNLWAQSRDAWEAIVSAPGKNILVVTHKSILRALLCTALGLGPEKFRAVDVSNGGVCVFRINAKGEAMLESLNLTAHLHTEGVYYSV